MKRILSIMLMIALVFTTLALPMSAFAANNVTMELVYAIDTVNDQTFSGGEIYPGDVVAVSLSLKASAETKINLIELENIVPEGLGLTWAAVDGIKNDSTVGELFGDGEITVTTAGTKLMSGTVTMPDAATSYTLTANTDVGEAPSIYGSDKLDWEIGAGLTLTPVTITVVQPENSISVDGTVLQEGSVDTIYKSSATITWSSESTTAKATYKFGDAEPVEISASGIAVSEAGTYTVTISYGAAQKFERSFILYTGSVDGIISTAIADDGKALKYEKGDTFTVPVVLTSGPDTNIVGMVGFKVTYDATALSLAEDVEDAKVEIKNNSEVTWTSDNVTYLKAGDSVTTLKFTVLDTAEYGNESIAFEGVGIALEGSLDTTGAELGVSNASVSILVKPETLAAVDTDDITTKWTNVAYEVDVTTNAGTTVVYSGEDLVDNAESYASWFNDGADLSERKDEDDNVIGTYFTVDAYKDYAVVTKLGENPVEYQVTIIKAADTKFDKTVPVVTAGAGMNWLRTDDAAKTIDVATFATATDNIPADGTIKAEYYIGTPETITWTEAVGGVISIDKGAQDAKVTIKWTDEAGNATEAKEYALKLDATAPVITVTEPEQVVDGKKTVTFKVTDAVGEVAPDSIKVVTSNTGDITAANPGTEVTATLNGDTYSFDVAETTWYQITASDKADIEAEAKSGKISFAVATKTTTLTVQVVKGDNKPTLNFYDTATMANEKKIADRAGAILDGNGTFTYAKITLPADQDEIDTTVTVANAEGVYTTETYEFTEVGDYVITIINKDASGNEESSTFKFSIVEPANILTVNGNSVYDVADYGRVRDLNAESKKVPDSTSLFYGGYYSGDLTGNGECDVDDLTELISNLKSRIKLPADSNYPILNK